MKDNNDPELNREELIQKLNLETGKIHWLELQRTFARGVLIVVAGDLSLIDAAVELTEDNKEQFEMWLTQGKIWRANDLDAKRWNDSNQVFWSVVIAPWVLVQEVDEHPGVTN